MKLVHEKANNFLNKHKATILLVVSVFLFFIIIITSLSLYDFIQTQNALKNEPVAFKHIPTNETVSSSTLDTTVSSYNQAVFDSIKINGESFAVFDPNLHQIVAKKNATTSYPLASITKVMTALVAYETIPENKSITIISSDTLPDGTSAVKEGTTWKRDDLISYTLTVSSNDGARALARSAGEYLEGTSTDPRASFIEKMNQKAKSLGLESLVFYNEHGLDESPKKAGSYGNASDIARLLWNAYRNAAPVFEKTTENNSVSVSSSGVITTKNTNQNADRTPGLTLSKTGYTDLAHGNLGIIFEPSPGRPVVIVVLHSTKEQRFSDVEIIRKKVLEAMR